MSIAPARLKNVNAPDVIKGPSDAPSPVLCGPPRRRRCSGLGCPLTRKLSQIAALLSAFSVLSGPAHIPWPHKNSVRPRYPPSRCNDVTGIRRLKIDFDAKFCHGELSAAYSKAAGRLCLGDQT